MPSDLELQLQEHLMKYLSGQDSLAEFEDWFLPQLWELDELDELSQSLAGGVHILISEYSRGDRSLEDLKSGLAGAIRTADRTYYGEVGQRGESASPFILVAA